VDAGPGIQRGSDAPSCSTASRGRCEGDRIRPLPPGCPRPGVKCLLDVNNNGNDIHTIQINNLGLCLDYRDSGSVDNGRVNKYCARFYIFGQTWMGSKYRFPPISLGIGLVQRFMTYLLQEYLFIDVWMDWVWVLKRTCFEAYRLSSDGQQSSPCGRTRFIHLLFQ
jgi:hypothetical protein